MLVIIISLSFCKKVEIERPAPITFNPSIIYGSMTDVEGNTYKTVTIGAQTWMAENLRTTRFNDGTVIPHLEGDTSCLSITTPGYYWYNNKPDIYKNVYGALYNGYAVKTGKLAPIGWHVPLHNEWEIMIAYLGGDSIAGEKLKESDTIHWMTPYWLEHIGSNESGFTALPGGYHCYNYSEDAGYAGFEDLSGSGNYWTATEFTSTGNLWYFLLHWLSPGVKSYETYKSVGFSVRCVKDE
jgi:uncharacterized protein (TIGR02145 family)